MAAFSLRHVGVQVNLGGGDLFVTEPKRHHRDIRARLEQSHSCGVPQGVHADVLAAQLETRSINADAPVSRSASAPARHCDWPALSPAWLTSHLRRTRRVTLADQT